MKDVKTKFWISVNEELPGDDRGILLLKNADFDDGPAMGYYYPERKCFYVFGDSDFTFPVIVTHWFKIPD